MRRKLKLNFSFISISLIICQMPKNFLTQLSTDQYLTHYWPISNGTTNDEKGAAHMLLVSLTSFASDRFGNINSVISLNGGWTQVPSGVYFNTPEFTISVWVYPQQVVSWSRIIDFGNGQSLDNIVFALSEGTSLKPILEIYSGSNKVISTISSQTLNLNQWEFLTVTFNGKNSRIYLNGTLTADLSQTYILPNIFRTNCYIGRSNWPDGYSWSLLDDLRFYNKSLNQTEITDIMNNKTVGTDQYLTHHWPFSNGTIIDAIASADMSVILTSYASDRFGNANSALALNGGYTIIPSGVYFDSPAFSISVWVYPQQVGDWSRIIDFGNGPYSDNIQFALSSGNSLKPTL